MKEQILNYLKAGNMIDNILAWQHFQTFSLKGIIKALRDSGEEIADIWCRSTEGKRFKKYFMYVGKRRKF